MLKINLFNGFTVDLVRNYPSAKMTFYRLNTVLGESMPVATYEQYCQMLDRALERGFAYPAINVTSTSTANAAIAAFAEAGSDGIIQVSTGGGEFASGQAVKNAAIGAISLAQHVHLVAQEYDILIALHTDHCHPNKVEPFLIPLIEETEKRRAADYPIYSIHTCSMALNYH